MDVRVNSYTKRNIHSNSLYCEPPRIYLISLIPLHSSSRLSITHTPLHSLWRSTFVPSSVVVASHSVQLWSNWPSMHLAKVQITNSIKDHCILFRILKNHTLFQWDYYLRPQSLLQQGNGIPKTSVNLLAVQRQLKYFSFFQASSTLLMHV